MNDRTSTADEFRCPGEPGAISRAVHRARLAGFYPKCRGCVHRTDLAGFSDKLAEQIAEVHAAAPSPTLLDGEGIGGTLLNELTPDAARRAGAAFGLLIREYGEEGCWPTVLLAGDGRRLSAPLVAAAAAGLRWAGCNVVDVGAATSGCLAFALGQSKTDGAMLVGNPGRRSHEGGLRFWNRETPLGDAGDATRTPSLDRLKSLFHGRLDRPTRRFGSLDRVSFENDYLESLSAYYHGLRPLRVVLDTPCRPLVEYVERLSKSLECRFFHDPGATASDVVVREKAHLGIEIDGDGERCRAIDEQGRAVADQRLLRLVARHALLHRDDPPPTNAPGEPAIVVEEETSAATEHGLRGLGYRVVRAGRRRADMHRAMKRERARLGGGPSGRLWHGRSGHAAADALVTLSLLLVALSQCDCPFSRVLDESVEAE